MAMSAAVFTPSLALCSSSSCAAAPQQPAGSSNSSSSTNEANSMKLLSLSAAAMQPTSSVLHPGLEFANLMWFRGSYNAQVFVGEDEPADSVVRRFRKTVMQAGVISERRRRRFHETPHDIVKQEQQNALCRRIRVARGCEVRFSSSAGAGSVGDFSDAAGVEEEQAGSSWDDATAARAPLPQFYDAFWRFLRPHTIRGTFLGTTALVTRALLENSSLIDWILLPKALRGLLALLCGNGFIVGINQIYDVGIDKMNKPFLPIAAGDLSVPSAWTLVLGLAALGIGIVATNFGPLITTLYSFGLFLGTVYSVPPMRLKQYAVSAFLIIATVRGFLLNFGVYYATRAALGLPYQWSPSIVFITIFLTLFATVIAITKDLPDVEGDKKFNIATFSTKVGVRRVSFLGAGLLLTNYIGAILAGIFLPQAFKPPIMIVGHAALGISLVYQTWLLDTAKYSKEAIANFYRFIWNLFYSEYALLPFI